MSGDSRVVRGDAIGVRRDDRGDLEREGLWVSMGPERGATAGVLDRERERQPAVGERPGTLTKRVRVAAGIGRLLARDPICLRDGARR
jgi:hypothetical protein